MQLETFIPSKYHLPYSEQDRVFMSELDATQQTLYQERILAKYGQVANLLGQSPPPMVRDALMHILDLPCDESLRLITRVHDLMHYKQEGYLDDGLFEQYCDRVLNQESTHRYLANMVQKAREENYSAEDFRNYLHSGLFDQRVYRLNRGLSTEELKELARELGELVQRDYRLELVPIDENFIKNNQVRNRHILFQIVVPKYRLVHQIKQILQLDDFDQSLQQWLQQGYNHAMPLLKRMRDLAEYYHAGLLNRFLLRKAFYFWIHNRDQLFEFLNFIETLQDHIGKERMNHYLELGLYEVWSEAKHQRLLKIEQVLFEIAQIYDEGVREYLNIMNTPVANASLVTNGRLLACMQKFNEVLKSIYKNSQLLNSKHLFSRLESPRKQLFSMLEDLAQRNPMLPGTKPYKLIENLRQIGLACRHLQTEALLQLSIRLILESRSVLEALMKSTPEENPMGNQVMEVFQKRAKAVEAFKSGVNVTPQQLEMLPLENHSLYLLESLTQKGKNS